MSSGKYYKYMKQYGERNYAAKVRKIEKGDLSKHSNRSKSGKASKASSSNCIQQSKKEKVTLQSLLHDPEHDLSSYGRQVILSDAIVSNEPHLEKSSLVVQAYEKACKTVRKLKKRQAKES